MGELNANNSQQNEDEALKPVYSFVDEEPEAQVDTKPLTGPQTNLRRASRSLDASSMHRTTISPRLRSQSFTKLRPLSTKQPAISPQDQNTNFSTNTPTEVFTGMDFQHGQPLTFSNPSSKPTSSQSIPAHEGASQPSPASLASSPVVAPPETPPNSQSSPSQFSNPSEAPATNSTPVAPPSTPSVDSEATQNASSPTPIAPHTQAVFNLDDADLAEPSLSPAKPTHKPHNKGDIVLLVLNIVSALVLLGAIIAFFVFR